MIMVGQVWGKRLQTQRITKPCIIKGSLNLVGIYSRTGHGSYIGVNILKSFDRISTAGVYFVY